jgi:hypothetical protein
MLALGALAVALPYAAVGETALLPVAAGLVAAGLALEMLGLVFHVRHLQHVGGEGAAAHFLQRTDFGKTWIARNVGLAAGFVGAVALAFAAPLAELNPSGLVFVALLALVVAATALVGRALFYVLVIPTTMPGAFFWKNKGFEEHARETGLANLPQVGVLPSLH